MVWILSNFRHFLVWILAKKHQIHDGVRTSLENFGQLYYYDSAADQAERFVRIIPLYALSNLK